MNKLNYQKELEKILNDSKSRGTKLLLHSCCAPCSSYVLTYLSSFFEITVFYYNPNITNDSEYNHRVFEQKRLIDCLNKETFSELPEWEKALLKDLPNDLLARERDKHTSLSVQDTENVVEYEEMDNSRSLVDLGIRFPISVIEGEHDIESFYEASSGLENEPEGGARCAKCFRLRLQRTLLEAKKVGAPFFGTTLTISPLKNAELINNIGFSLEDEEVRWLPSDFKKKEGYKHSIELSAKYELYRQNFCGCEFSKQDTIVD